MSVAQGRENVTQAPIPPGAILAEVLERFRQRQAIQDPRKLEDDAALRETLRGAGAKTPEIIVPAQEGRDEQDVPDSSDKTIALMGSIGSGKSTFAKLLTNDNTIQIGHSLKRGTLDIQTIQYRMNGLRITLVDVPGFDVFATAPLTQADILAQLARFLGPESGKERKLNGIIYMHRISKNRFNDFSAERNLRIFRALCGEQFLPKVLIVATGWDGTEEEGSDVRKDLDASYLDLFQALLEAGAIIRRHDDTSIESAKRIMTDVIGSAPVTMQIQEELYAGTALADTSAAMTLDAEMSDVRKLCADDLAELRCRLEEAVKARSEHARSELEVERSVVEWEMVRAEMEYKRMQTTLTVAPESKRV